jgi:dTMP kinase
VTKGKFITFEGGEGAGKSTQVKLLIDAFANADLSAYPTREPGGTKGAESIRNLLVNGDVSKWSAKTETLLHLAARNDHVEKTIKPKLDAGVNVICDRFMDSTISYQGYGHGLGLDYVTDLQKIIIEDLAPDLTFIFDISVENGLARTSNRGNTENRYEKMARNFHENVRNGFLEIAKNNPDRCYIINADDDIRNIHLNIIEIIQERLKINLC